MSGISTASSRAEEAIADTQMEHSRSVVRSAVVMNMCVEFVGTLSSNAQVPGYGYNSNLQTASTAVAQRQRDRSSRCRISGVAMPSRRSARTLNALFVLQASLAVAILAGDVARRLNVVVVDNWADMKTQCECRIRSFSRAII